MIAAHRTPPPAVAVLVVLRAAAALVMFLSGAFDVRAEEALPWKPTTVPSGHAPAKAATASPTKKPGAAAAKKPVKAEKAPAKSDAALKTASRDDSSGGSSGEQAIVALVNDEPVTGYEIQQRAAMLGGSNLSAKAQEKFQALIKAPSTTERLKAILDQTIKANQGKSKDQIIDIFEARKKEFATNLQKQAVESARSGALPGLKKQALEELIDEKLKLQEAKRLSVTIAEDEVNKIVANIAERNKMTEAQFAAQVGGGLDAMKGRIRATLSWNDVIRRKFGAQIAVTGKDVDKFVAAATTAGEEQVELQVQRIRIIMPVKLDQATVAQRVQDAETIRSRFRDCKSTGSIAGGVPGAKFEDIIKKRPAGFPEPTRTLLLNAKDGEMLPPNVSDGAVDLWVVCGREVTKAEDQKRSQAEGELKQKEFELLGKRHLKDLRQDAHIEYR